MSKRSITISWATLLVCAGIIVMTIAQPIEIRAEEMTMTDPDTRRADVLREVMRKFGRGEKIPPAEWSEFVDAQNHQLNTGLKVGERIPDFALPDQTGTERKFRDLAGPSGLLLVFTRSADW